MYINILKRKTVRKHKIPVKTLKAGADLTYKSPGARPLFALICKTKK